MQQRQPSQQQQHQPQPQPSMDSHPSEAPLNLPPIQYAGMQATPSYGAPMPPPQQQQQQQQHQQHQQQHAPPYPPQQYQQYQPHAPMPSSSVQSTVVRYPLPPQPALDARQMSGGRHKKEIKRRTKTGCLTCRKRRIKCDEGVPTCRNCQKSKRECLGYDPIFKQQPSPANIQPAPSIHNPSLGSASASGSNLPPNTYGASQAYPGTGGTFIQAAGLPFESHYGNGTSLDPALSTGGEQAHHMAHHNNHPNALQPTRTVRAVPMDDLYSLNDIPPRYSLREAPPPVSPASQQELETFFKYHYAIGLDRLLETTWYSQHGLAQLHRDVILQDFVLQCVEQFKAREDANARQTQSLEARLVWLLATMPRNCHRMTNGARTSDHALQELLSRLDVVENLLTGQYLDPSRVSPPPQHQPPLPPGMDNSAINQKFNERSFWHHLARFVAMRDDTSNVHKEIDDVLSTLRNLLHMLENRDVLYSLAVARHIGGRMPDWHPQRHLVASTNDPTDPVGKLRVAQQFVESEDQRGTTQVIQRVCSMAIRAWILQKQ